MRGEGGCRMYVLWWRRKGGVLDLDVDLDVEMEMRGAARGYRYDRLLRGK